MIASLAIMTVALALEVLPRSLYDARPSVQLLQYLFSISRWLLLVHFDAEHIYPGYGNKFVLSCLMLLLVFLLTSACLIVATLRVNTKNRASAELENSKFRRLLILFAGFVIILVLQFVFPGLHLSPSGDKGNTAPFFDRGLMWASAEWVIAAMLVVSRRGSWRNAS